MTYAKRDSEGRIVGLFKEPAEGLDPVSPGDPDLARFLTSGDESEPLAFLQRSDLELVRVVEDLVELLVEKNLIMFTELPAAAQQKLMGRKQARESLSDDGPLMVGKDDIL